MRYKLEVVEPRAVPIPDQGRVKEFPLSKVSPLVRATGRVRAQIVLTGVVLFVSLHAVMPAIGQVRWRSAPADHAVAATPKENVATLRNLLSEQGVRHFIARLSQPADDTVRARLSQSGIELLAPLGDNAFFAVASGARAPDFGAIERLTALASIQPVDEAFKLHPALAAGELPGWAIVGRIMDQATQVEVDLVALYVMFHRDVPLAKASELVEAHQAVVQAELFSVHTLVIELPRSRIDAITALDAVQWIEPPLPQMSTVNSSNRIITQANTAQTVPYSLDGTGVDVMVYDGGTARATHQDFGGRLTVRDGSGMITHATHVAGTIGGSGAASGGANRGMAPGVIMQSYGFQVSGGGTFLYTNPGDLESDYNQAINTFDCDISNNSIGTNTEINGFSCSIQGDYGVTDALIDAIVRGSLGAPFRVVWAAGNERQGSRCDVEGFGDYYSIAPPSGAKNHICVGAINSNNDSMTSFSSWGPVDDGRLKPDIVAPGCQSNDDGGVTSCSAAGDASYTVSCGTSMACPTVTGLCALLLEDHRAQFPLLPDPRNSTLKVLLAHNAVDLGNTGPDYQFGYGSVRILNTIDFMRSGNFTESELSQGSVLTATVNVAPETPTLKITLAWDDAPGTPNISPALVNDLDLVVISPSQAQAFPWTLNPNNPSAAAVRTTANHVDNIEQVLVNSPEAGEWTVRIAGTNVPAGPQPFSIASSEPLSEFFSVALILPSGVPDVVLPGESSEIPATILAVNDSIVPGSELMHYRFDGGPFTSVPLTPLGGGDYSVTLPGPLCDDVPEFYFSVEGAASGVVTNPSGGAANPFTLAVGASEVPFEDDMEIDRGWTVGAAGGILDDNATTGVWVRVNPNGTAAQPEDDHTPPPGVICWVTGQGAVGGGLGDNDVDGGKTTLVSPILDLSDGDATISYWRWYSNDTGGGPNADTFRVDISNIGGGGWVNVETVGPAGAGTSGGWIFHSFDVGDFVTPTAQIRLRFVAEDAGEGSLVEAALDDFRVERFACVFVPEECPGILGDMDGSTVVDAMDVQGFVDANVMSPFFDPCADLAMPFGVLDSSDADAFVDLLLSQ